ncbi:MAG: sulfite dehydrogenase [Gammaproteobacteria bacterium]|nr:sulfite dehydrogenase [Gammaproteobacteria bacterium]MDH4314364.1 sulfite dehydrogenase [Gammaproteobacteria bacterium]MDH5214202.1 sulfite dehydrogenase [Gammaproteobacteria bacterium]MDH5499504.1 sulfite dehydrogenase [Gammaproteobacteria bacterium]
MTDIGDLPVAGNGLLNRRLFLQAGAAGAATIMTAQASAQDQPDSMRIPGAGMSESGAPSRYESELYRRAIASQPGTTGAGVSRTPLEHLDGIITPSRLHFERHHSGIPDIDPGRHRLIIHGLVKRPLSFSMDALARYPSVSRIQFLECSGNSGALLSAEPVQSGCGELHGLVSASEWGGVPLSALLAETGVTANARWIVASGADAAKMSRSVPLDKIMDDAIVALYQNGEPLRPANGYPMRLFLPGWEGNMSVKWLHTIKVVDQPAMTKDETSKYSDLQDDGDLQLFTFPMAVKSVITSPSPGLNLGSTGIYQVSGIAWSGAGRIRRVEVSADGGESWADAALDELVLPHCLTRFRSAWAWNGGPAVILSRATDEAGNVQPTRAAVLEGRAVGTFYHYNGIQAWQVNRDGSVNNVYV